MSGVKKDFKRGGDTSLLETGSNAVVADVRTQNHKTTAYPWRLVPSFVYPSIFKHTRGFNHAFISIQFM
jgi:hypothetical protein